MTLGDRLSSHELAKDRRRAGSPSKSEEHPMNAQDADVPVIASRFRRHVAGSFLRGALIGVALSLPIWALAIWALFRLVP
jgi:hypothetical protein